MKSGNTLRNVLIAKVLCCGGILLVFTGALSGVVGWISDISAASVVGALALSAAAILIVRRRANRNPPAGREPGQRDRSRDPKATANDE